MSRTSDVTVIGLGAMGAALARGFLAAGHTVTVWNRSPDKAKPLVLEGAAAAPSVAHAVSASELVLICVIDYAATEDLLRSAGVLAALPGRTVVVAATGTSGEAVALEELVTGHGAAYVDGNLMCFPRQIGAPETLILYAGDRAAFLRHEKTLAALAGNHRFLGEEVGSAATMYHALWAYSFSAVLGFIEATGFIRAAGGDLRELLEHAKGMTADLADEIENVVTRVQEQDYRGDQVSIDVYREGFVSMRSAFRERGIESEMLAAAAALTERAWRQGRRSEDLAAVVETLGTGAPFQAGTEPTEGS